MAALYDSLLVFALMALATLPFIAQRAGEAVEAYTLTHQLAVLGTGWLFFVGFWSFGGRTLGMQSWGLRIETVTGDKPNVWRSTVRFFAAVVSWLAFGLGFWWQIWDKEQLTWHDRLSGTRLRHYPR